MYLVSFLHPNAEELNRHNKTLDLRHTSARRHVHGQGHSSCPPWNSQLMLMTGVWSEQVCPSKVPQITLIETTKLGAATSLWSVSSPQMERIWFPAANVPLNLGLGTGFFPVHSSHRFCHRRMHRNAVCELGLRGLQEVLLTPKYLLTAGHVCPGSLLNYRILFFPF